MVVGSGAIASQCRYAFECSGLCLDIVGGKRAAHAVAQGAIAARHRERGQKMEIDRAVAVGIAQEAHLKVCREIVVERQSTAVGYAVGTMAQSYLGNQPLDNGGGILGARRAVTLMGCHW